MDLNTLLEKHQRLLAENKLLKKEIQDLKKQLGSAESLTINNTTPELESSLFESGQECEEQSLSSHLNNQSDPMDKIRLFMSLFNGRSDVYARRWENSKKGTSGYSPFCLNEWKPELCAKPNAACSKCKNKAFAVLDEKAIDDHLRGKTVVGIYPMLIDETCHFLAIDFDEGEWQKDISALRDACSEFDIPVSVERSRSGNGAHAWFFFENALSAILARKLGSALLTHSMIKRHEITFKSYDRFFPNQDTLPRGGLGNLIALPLQKDARNYKNSVFVDENFKPYDDQWQFLATIKKISKENVERHISKLCHGDELGTLKIDSEEVPGPPETTMIKLSNDDFPHYIEIIKANMLFIPKNGISHRALNQLKRYHRYCYYAIFE